MKKIYYVLITTLLISSSTFAQESEKKSKVNVDTWLQSMFYWRGAPLSVFSNDNGTPSPLLIGEVSYGTGGFKIGAWTGQSFEKDGYKNASYYVSYSTGRFTVMLWDIFTYTGIGATKNPDFFNFKNSTTQHFIDLDFSYNFKDIPLSLLWATVIYGRDGAVVDGKFKNRYSTYLKATYRLISKKDVSGDVSLDLYASIGGALNDIDETSFYGTADAGKTSFGMTEIGITGNKNIKFSESLTVPISVGVVASPLNKRFDGIVAIKLF